ncbi:MAG: hypothetical protein OXN97_21710 [Bryobacterales bacterium]|nr:hypothetical protein [Bryobacterales bacterium]
MSVALDPQIREILKGFARTGRRHLPGLHKAAEHMQNFKVDQVWRMERFALPADDSRNFLAGCGR